MADVFRVTFSALAPPAFAALAGMVSASVPGVVRLEIHEQHCDERTLVVRTIERDTEATILDVEWEIAFAALEESRLVVRFREAPESTTLEKMSCLLRTWIETVSLGAFAPPGDGCSAAVLRQLAPGDAQEVVAELEHLACAYEAFEALFQALEGLNEEHAIERVQVPCPTRGFRPDPPKTNSDTQSRSAAFDLTKGT